MSAEREYELADLVSLTLDEPALLFVRARRPMTDEEFSAFAHGLTYLPRLPGVKTVAVPHDVELFCVGEAELQKIGWTKIPASPPPEPRAPTSPDDLAPIGG